MNFPSWTAAAVDGKPVVFELDDSVEPYGLVGWRYSTGWRRYLAEPVDTPVWLGAATLDDGTVAVVTDGTFDGIAVRQLEDKVVVAEHEHSGSTLMAELVGIIVSPSSPPILLTGLFALVLAGRMERHRITEHRDGRWSPATPR